MALLFFSSVIKTEVSVKSEVLVYNWGCLTQSPDPHVSCTLSVNSSSAIFRWGLAVASFESDHVFLLFFAFFFFLGNSEEAVYSSPL